MSAYGACERFVDDLRTAESESNVRQETAAHPFRYSMVVDGLPIHPYQAEILLVTLEEFGGVPRDRVIAQCTGRVKEEVRRTFEGFGCRVSTFPSGVDGARCNKVAQLDYFLECRDASATGVFLLDLDLAVLTALNVPDPEIIWGRAADDPNPPFAAFERSFSAAGIELPGETPRDWQWQGNTVATDLGGGVIYVPRPLLARLRSGWRRWIEFLLSRPAVLGESSSGKDVARISYAMALASERLPFSCLPANWSFPCHRTEVPGTFGPEEDLHAIRYHSGLDTFGLIEPGDADNVAVDAAVERVNAALGRRRGTLCFDLYKRHLARRARARAPAISEEIFSRTFVARARIGDRKRRLILHAGTPKTGTTSLQRHLSDHREVLADNGWWYPPPSGRLHIKHQKLVSVLQSADERAFVEYVETALRDMPDHAHAVILSTEGIFNHWWDYPPRAKGLLQRLAALFDFELCVWFRPPEDFAISSYAQNLRNPGGMGAGAPTGNVYGTDIDFIDAIRDEWGRLRLDYLGFYYEALQLFGCGRVEGFLYTGDTVRKFLDRFGIEGLPAYCPRQNVSLRRAGTEMMRIVNRFGLDRMEKARVEELIFEIDGIIGERAGRFRLTQADRALVLRYAQRGWDVLQPLLSGREERDPVREA